MNHEAPLQGDRRRFAEVIDALCSANETLIVAAKHDKPPLPTRASVQAIVDDLRAVLFPGHFGAPDVSGGSLRTYVGARLARARLALTDQLSRAFAFACDHRERDGLLCKRCDHGALVVTETVIASLPRLRALLETDVRAAFAGDVAARSLDETLFCCPGLRAIIHHRLAHELYLAEVPLIPRIVSQLAHAKTGIDIHPGAEIGPSFFIDHGTGVVIGEASSIGERVRLHQGVTLGSRAAEAGEQLASSGDERRQPIIEDDVVIYAGATILGPVVIGRGARIGGNVWLTRSVPAGSNVSQARLRRELFENGSGI
jgi:serine O-acetyltransferase